MQEVSCHDNLEIVKNLAKLALFFSLSFVIIFLASTGVRFLSLWIEWVCTLPPKDESFLNLLISAAHWALSLALYGALLLSLSYAVRKHYFALMTIVCLIALSFGLTFGILSALEHWKSVPSASINSKPLGERGVMLSKSLNKNETVYVLLNGTAFSQGPRVVAQSGKPMNFQTANPGFDLPQVSLGNKNPWFFNNLSTDIKLNANQLSLRYNAGFIPFLMYAGALIFFLCSLGFVIKFSAWPLANLFLGFLVFRGVLALEIFFNSPEIQDVFFSFLNNKLPLAFTVPFIFLGFGLMIYIYSILVFAAKRRNDDDY